MKMSNKKQIHFRPAECCDVPHDVANRSIRG